ncbi:MAG: radical SAM family heme chaperone HemW [Planctomycetes bacterium]|nr:radical SAM family heme chaperone HemW [Planctomycetota bacterium]
MNNRDISSKSTRRDCSLYIHIPFCVRKCRYCAFYSIPASVEIQRQYVSAVKRELAMTAYKQSFDTIFLGGGSPTAMTESLLLELAMWAGAKIKSGNEFTIEVNPGQTNAELFKKLKTTGVNRISIGAQSFNDKELEFLGRIHNVADIVRCVEDARKAGFENISIDLIFAIPGQTTTDWKHSLDEAVRLAPPHISAYSLTYEGDTPLVRALAAGQIEIIDEETDAVMYESAMDTLETAGLVQYEISNFAKAGFECRHNLRYWLNKSYIGLGPAAAGCYDGKRTENVADVQRWLEAIDAGRFAYETQQSLSAEDIACETAVLNLRTRFGIEPVAFERQTGYDIQKLFAAPVMRHLNAGLLEWHEGRLRLTRAALPIADKVLCDFAAI